MLMIQIKTFWERPNDTSSFSLRVIFHFRNLFLIVRSVVVDTQYYGQIRYGDRMLHRVKASVNLFLKLTVFCQTFHLCLSIS